MLIFWSELQSENCNSIQMQKTTIGYFVLVWKNVEGEICGINLNEQS
jgi:hypothetical protein